MADDRNLFADEQAYIAHKRHMEVLERQRLRQEAQARIRNRPPKMGPRVKRAMQRAYARQRRARIRSNPVTWEAHKSYQRVWQRTWRERYPERAHANDRRRHYKHYEERRLAAQVYYWDHRESEAARKHDWYQKNREKVDAKNRAWNKAHREQLNAAQRADYAAHRDEIAAYRRARYAAKKAAQQQQPQDDQQGA